MSVQPRVRVSDLQKLYPVSRGMLRPPVDFIHAIDGVSFEILPGESLGLVGESGCGKTTTGRMLVDLDTPTSGSIEIERDGALQNIDEFRGKGSKEFRREVQMIFQDPYESMNPRRTVYDTVSEPLTVQGIGDTVHEREERVADVLQHVGLTPPAAYMFRFPHELSGGQRQRVAIARALILGPTLVVADEPTSMLDVSIRIAIMRLMLDLASDLDVSYLYITHDLSVARYMCDRIAVMYLGKIVEIAKTEDLLTNPQHPYTKALLAAVPVPDPSFVRGEPDIKGGISKAINPPTTCRFLERCPVAEDRCHTLDHPPLKDLSDEHFAACHLVGD